jgi:universal stress protein A
MKLFEKILCPIDFSEDSVKALHWTQHLAKQYESEVVILHVMHPFSSTMELGVDYDRYHSAVVRDMDAFLSPLTVQYQSMQSSGEPAEKIMNLTKTIGVSLIVMGTRGLRGMAHRLIGSTAETVIRHASVPVMTLSPGCSLPKEIGEQRTLVPISDLTWPITGYIRLRKIIRELNTPVSMMHVIDMKNRMFDTSFDANPYLVTTYQTAEKAEALRTIGFQLDRDGHAVQAVIQFGDVSTEILKEADTNNYSWILMGAKRHKIFSRFFGSTTYGVISKAQVPVLTIGV